MTGSADWRLSEPGFRIQARSDGAGSCLACSGNTGMATALTGPIDHGRRVAGEVE